MLEILQVHEPLAAVADELINTSLYASRLLLPILLLIVLAFSLVRSLMASQSITLDFKLLIRGLVMMLVITVYPEIMQILSLALSGFTNLFNLEDEQLAEVLTSLTEQAAGTPEENESFLGSVSSWFSDRLDGINAIQWSVTGWIQEGLIFLVRAGVSLVRAFLLVFLFLIGPISLALSIIPGFQQTATSWLKGFMGVAFWNLSLNILDNLVAAYNSYALQLIANGDEFSISYGFLVNIVITLVYLITPVLTNYFISTGGPASLLGSILTAGAATLMAGGYATRLASKRPQGSKGKYQAYTSAATDKAESKAAS